MSCYYKALARLIPEVILSVGRGSEIAIVSPWIHKVYIKPPIFGDATKRYSRPTIELREFIKRMLQDFDYRVILLVRLEDPQTQQVVNSIVDAAPANVTVREYPYIHAKMIVTPTFAIETTANMIHTSLHRNIESCTLVNNRFSDTRRYLRDKLGNVI